MAENDFAQNLIDEFDRAKARAEAGDAGAMCHLAGIYSRERNGGLALTWYRKAADAGNAEAMYQLGNHCMYHDQAEALDWYKKSAAHGFTPANEKVAELESETS